LIRVIRELNTKKQHQKYTLLQKLKIFLSFKKNVILHSEFKTTFLMPVLFMIKTLHLIKQSCFVASSKFPAAVERERERERERITFISQLFYYLFLQQIKGSVFQFTYIPF